MVIETAKTQQSFNMKKKKRSLFCYFFVAIVTGLTVYTCAFNYLHRTDPAVKSDVIVVFIGPTYNERLKEGHQLMKDGYAANLIIPALHRHFVMVNGKITRTGKYKGGLFHHGIFPRYYENTHKEALMAKEMMKEEGYTSALFVSAPYHMRRIGIISEKVFNSPDYRLRFIGSRYIQSGGFPLIFSWSNIKQVLIEYYKIFGFYLYHTYETVKLKMQGKH